MADPRAASPAFARAARTIAVVWLALLGLMLASLGSAYLKLGPWNMAAGLAIAAIKAALVACLYMRLREAGGLIRLVAAVGVGVWLILLALSGIDYATRHVAPASLQRPEQLPSWPSQETMRPPAVSAAASR